MCNNKNEWPKPLNKSPNFAFFHRIHSRAGRTIEIVRKVTHIADGADHTEFVGRMDVGGDQKDVEFVASDAAPGLRHRNPKQLLRIVLESR